MEEAAWSSRIRRVGLIATVGAAACSGEGPAAPPAVSAIEVTSPLGSLWDVGTVVQLVAAAKDAQGGATGGASFAWVSSNPAVASVDESGRVTTLAPGPVSIRASAGGVDGTLVARVVDADAAGIMALATDEYVAALVAATSTDVRGRLQSALSGCRAGTESGNLDSVDSCAAALLEEELAAADPTDRTLLAILSLFARRIEVLLDL